MDEKHGEGRRPETARNRQRRGRFLKHLAVSGNITESGRVAGVRTGTLYRWKEADPDFAVLWREALDEAADALEAEARRRAVEGYDEPITYGGKVVCDPATGHPLIRKKYSDGLMAFLLKAHRPARFGGGEEQGAAISIRISQDDSAL